MSETDFSISCYRKHPETNSWKGLVTLVKKCPQKKYQVNSCNNVHEQASQSLLLNHKNSHNSTLNKNLQFRMWHLPAFYMLMLSKSFTTPSEAPKCFLCYSEKMSNLTPMKATKNNSRHVWAAISEVLKAQSVYRWSNDHSK